MKNLKKAFLFLACGLWLLVSCYSFAQDLDSQLKEVIPQADEFVVKSRKPLYYEARSKGAPVGFCFFTTEVAPDASMGAGGPIEILVATDLDGKISAVRITKHRETPEYAGDIDKPAFLGQFKGKMPADKFSIGQDVQAVTGATISSEVVARAIRESLLKIWPVAQATPQPITLLRPGMRAARYWKALKEKAVQCLLCPRACVIDAGKKGACGVRQNFDGTLYTLVYGTPCAVHVDPIEKKPMFHMLPSTQILSIATAGCNLRCIFCQNWEISQALPGEVKSENLAPEEVIRLARKYNSPSIAFTYTEPTIFFEYMIDTAKLAKEQGIRTVMHTCGYINEEPLRELCKYLDGANVDLKGFTDEFYRKIGKGKLKPVLDSIRILKEEGIWLEITNLVIPTLNDDPQQIRAMCNWIAGNIGPDVPVHFSRFYPAHKLTNLPPTPVRTLEAARKIAQEAGLKYVYIGNVPGHSGENTYCPKCKKAVIERVGYFVNQNNLAGGKCRFCGEKIPGIWE